MRHDIVQPLVARIEEPLDAPGGLPDALLVLDQGQADIIVAMLAEPDAGRDRDLGPLDQQLGEFEAAKMPEALGDLHPGEHGGGRRRNRPAGRRECFHHDVAPRLVDGAHLGDAIVRSVQRGGGRDLDGRVGAVIEVALHPRQGRQQALVADRKAHPPSRHRDRSWTSR